MSANAFSPQENLTAALAVTSTSTVAPIQVKATVPQGAMTQRAFYNAGPNDCFVAATSTAAKAVAVVPTAGPPAPSSSTRTRRTRFSRRSVPQARPRRYSSSLVKATRWA